jgi:hypothetical protein
VLRGVVLAGDVIGVDVARTIGMPGRLAGFIPGRIEGELIERAVAVARCELDDMTTAVVFDTIDRAVAVDRLAVRRLDLE